VISLFNNKYKVAANLAKKKVQVRYDPESLEQIEIYIDGRFRQRAKRLKITAHRGPKQLFEQTEDKTSATDYLGWLTHSVKQKDAIDKTSNKMTKSAFLKILKNRIAAEVFDADLAGEFYNTYGPFDSSKLHDAIDTLLGGHPANLHLSFYLTHIKNSLIGE
jgi:hypothetical protein